MNKLKHIEINIWKACNNKCRFCMSSKSELWDIKFVAFDILKEKIKWYADNWYKSIGFLWGDISIHPKMVEVVQYCKDLKFQSINLISNGMKFDDMNLATRIVEAWATRMNFSIHSHIDTIEDYLIQVPGWLKRKMKAIDNFQILHAQWKLKDALSINIVLNSKNYTTIVESVLYFFIKKKVNDIRINFIWLNQDTRENWDDLKVTYEKFLPYLKRLIYISLKYNIRITFDTVPACILYKIDPKNYRNIVKKFLGEDQDHIVEIDHINNNDNFDWKQRKKDMLKTQFDDCEKCIYRENCQWVRKGYVEMFWWKEFDPILSKSNHSTAEKYTHQKKNNDLVIENSKVDIKKYYVLLKEEDVSNIAWEIEKLYKNNLEDNQICNLFSVLLSKQKKYLESINVLKKMLKTVTNKEEKWNYYFNIAVNNVNLDNNLEAEEYLEKAKIFLEDKENFKNYYNAYYWKVKVENIDNFKDIIVDYYKGIDNQEILEKYSYVETLINWITKK